MNVFTTRLAILLGVFNATMMVACTVLFLWRGGWITFAGAVWAGLCSAICLAIEQKTERKTR